jgi:hypothetical protein
MDYEYKARTPLLNSFKAYVPNLDDCRLGNIYKIITDRHFALLALNPDDCKVHLIFSDESNPDRLNQRQLTSHNPHSRCADHPAVSLYTDDHGMLQPIYIAYNRTPEHGERKKEFNIGFKNDVRTKKYTCHVELGSLDKQKRFLFFSWLR